MKTFSRKFGLRPGAALSALALAVACAAPAMAQSAAEAQGRGSSGATEPTASSRGIPQSQGVDDSVSPDIAPIIPSGDPSEDPPDPEAEDGDTPRPRFGQRAAVRDGDLAGEEPALVRDGVIDVGEPLPPEDGADPTQIDSREPDEAALFTNPVDTNDALLFQIEDIEPVRTDRRPERFARLEPYDPIGIRIGSFVYFPELEVGGLYQSNLFRRSDAEPDVAAEVRNTSRLVSNWSTHALELQSTSNLTFHNEFPDEDDRAWSVEARGRIDIQRRTNLQIQALHDVRQEGRSAIDSSVGGDRADVTNDEANLTLNHRFNRLSVRLRGGISDTVFELDDVSGSSSGGTNSDRDTVTTEQAVRASWEFKPTFSVFGEAETNQREYDVAALSDGLRRDSDGQRYRVGVDFGSTGETLRGEVSIGYGLQDPEANRLSDVDGILIDANIAYRFSELTSFLLTARTDLFDTNTTGSAGVIAQQIGLEARHAFRRYLIANAGISYTSQDFAGVDIEESELRATLGFEYFVNREFVLYGRYEHFNFESNEPDGDWQSDDVRMGVRWRR